MVIKTTDFKLEAFIPNVDDAPNSEVLGNDELLQDFIDKYEKEILIRLLGYTLYSDLISQFTDGELDPVADAKWDLLINGVDNYRGMTELIVGFVFYKFIENDDSHFTTSHVVKETTENSELYESRSKAISQYRTFYEHAIGSYYSTGVYVKTSGIFSGLTGIIYSGVLAGNSNFKSLYSYLTDNLIDFSEWQPETFKNKNYFDA